MNGAQVLIGVLVFFAKIFTSLQLYHSGLLYNCSTYEVIPNSGLSKFSPCFLPK